MSKTMQSSVKISNGIQFPNQDVANPSKSYLILQENEAINQNTSYSAKYPIKIIVIE